MIRFIPALTDEHIQQAVMNARAVVALDERLAHAQAEIAQRDERIAELQQAAQRGEQHRRELVERLSAVRNLHWEHEEVSCGDGCCHEGTGVCRYCNEPWPCRTYRAAEGEDETSGTSQDDAQAAVAEE